MISKEEMGKIISIARKNKKMRQEDLAKMLNVTDKAISNWETGKNYPDLTYIKDLENILDINLISHNKKTNLLFLIISISLIIISLVLGIILLNQNHEYSIESSKEGYMLENAFLIETLNTTRIHISSISQNYYFSNTYNYVSLYIKKQDNIEILTEETDYKGIDIEVKRKLSKKELQQLYLDYYYVDSKGEQTKETIKLNVNTNKKESTKTNKNILLNYGYREITPLVFEKVTDDTWYRYNEIKKELYIRRIEEMGNNDINIYHIIYDRNKNEYTFTIIDSHYNILASYANISDTKGISIKTPEIEEIIFKIESIIEESGLK